MNRRVYWISCGLAALLAGAPAVCFGSPQDMGEMVHLGANAPSPVNPMRGRSVSQGAARHSRTTNGKTTTSGGVTNLHWSASEMRAKGTGAESSAKKADAGKAEPAFVVYGSENPDNSASDATAKQPKPEAAPAKDAGAGSAPHGPKG